MKKKEIAKADMINLLMGGTTKREMAIIIDVVNVFIKLLEEDDYSFVDKDYPERSREDNIKIFRNNAIKRAMDIVFGKW